MEQQEERTKPAHKCGIYGIYGHAGSAACSQYHHWVCPSSGKRLAHDSQVMVKEFIKGREITVGVLGNAELTALPLVEVIPESRYDFFDYEAKYTPGATREVCPAEVEDAIRDKAQEYGLRAHKALQLRGCSRTDMIIREDGGIFLLETNTIPGMTPTSLLPQAAAQAGLDFSALLDRLIELAMERRD